MTAGTWTNIVVSLDKFGVANKQNMTGFWLQETVGKSLPSFYLDDVQLAP